MVLKRIFAAEGLWFKIVGLIVFGISLPHFAGLLCTEMTPVKYLLISYVYFSLSFILIWKINRSYAGKVSRYASRFDSAMVRLGIVLGTYVLVTTVIFLISVLFWYKFIVQIRISWTYTGNFLIASSIAVLIFSNLYETLQLYKSVNEGKSRSESLKNIQSKLELTLLKNQIDAHFLFNSLHTLSFLIEIDKQKAEKFNEGLAEIYRFLIENGSKEFISLKEELGFAGAYFRLQQIRYSEGISMEIQIPEEDQNSYLLPPVSLQILVENAVKHNSCGENNPLSIVIGLEEDSLFVRNNIADKKTNRSTGVGLENLNKRYELLLHKSLTVTKTSELFEVRLPLQVRRYPEK